MYHDRSFFGSANGTETGEARLKGVTEGNVEAAFRNPEQCERRYLKQPVSPMLRQASKASSGARVKIKVVDYRVPPLELCTSWAGLKERIRGYHDPKPPVLVLLQAGLDSHYYSSAAPVLLALLTDLS